MYSASFHQYKQGDVPNYAKSSEVWHRILIFDVSLNNYANKIDYRMKSKHSELFYGTDGFLQGKAEVLKGISKLRNLS